MTPADAAALRRAPADDPARKIRVRRGIAGFPRGAAGTVARVDQPPADDPAAEYVYVAVRCQGVPDVLPFSPSDLLVR